MKINVYNQLVFIPILVITLLLTGCEPSAEELQATKTKIAVIIFATQTASVPTATYTPSPTHTYTPQPTSNRTATAAQKATSTAQPMANLIQQLYTDGYLQSTQGEYFQLDLFQENLTEIDWVEAYHTGLYKDLGDFVLHSNISWNTAKKGANIKYSGCGFWFGVDNDINNFYEVFVGLDGNVDFNRCLNDCPSPETLESNSFGEMKYQFGKVDLIFSVDEGTVQIFINGEQILIKQNLEKLTGELYYAISSGTNVDYGTQCTFTHTEIWHLEP